jgi:hypothetical protein
VLRRPDARLFTVHPPTLRPGRGSTLVGLFLLVAAAAEAQVTETLTGRVVDAFTGEPIAGAVVALELTNGMPATAGSARTFSDPTGAFELWPVPEGEVRLRVEHGTYGTHSRDLRVEGQGTGAVEVRISRLAIELEPVVVEVAGGAGEPVRSPDVIGRAAIEQAMAVGADLSDLLRRNIAGIVVRRPAGTGGQTCIEFRGARREPDQCNPPVLLLDGVTMSDPSSLYATYNIEDLAEIQFLSPAQAGTRYGLLSGWGAILLTSRRAAAASLPLVRRTGPSALHFAWSEAAEGDTYPWAKVYSAAFVGNALGLAAGAALLSQCMDLGTRRFYRGDEYCGGGAMLGAALLTALLPPLTAGLAARIVGSTEQSRGSLQRSIAYSAPILVPGLALMSLNAGERGLGAPEVAGLAMVVVVAPLLNTLADRAFRGPR